MTIETSPAQNAPRPAATESKNAKTKAADANAPTAGSPGGFMAILASLDTSEPAALTAADAVLPSDASGALALAALQRAAGKGDSAGDVDLAAAEADLRKLLQSSVVDIGVANLPPPKDIPWQPDVLLETSALLAQAAQWSPIPTAGAAQSMPGALKGVPANFIGAGKPGFGSDKADGKVLASTALGDAIGEVSGKAGKAQKDAFARMVSAQAALAEPAVANSPAAEARLAQALQRVVEAPQNSIASALAVATSAAFANREDTGRERSVFRSNAPDVASPVQTYMPSASTASFANAPAPVASIDTFVAEKVAYWISNDVQNAEMKLDGLGEMPVEVSIRMQGNEAHIAFRSDELQARAALENASQHLKDMLQREGLVLSGVSVGTAGAGDGGAQERKSRQGARQAGIVSVEPVPTDSVAGSKRSTGGALDLFV